MFCFTTNTTGISLPPQHQLSPYLDHLPSSSSVENLLQYTDLLSHCSLRSNPTISSTTKSTNNGDDQGRRKRRKSEKSDRHSKIITAKGPRNRRVRLSMEIGRKFFDLQDLLGFDKASKTLDWLFQKSHTSIKELIRMKNIVDDDDPRAKISLSFSDQLSCENSLDLLKKSTTAKPKKKKKKKMEATEKKAKENNGVREGLRKKARERARERTKQKLVLRKLISISSAEAEAETSSISSSIGSNICGLWCCFDQPNLLITSRESTSSNFSHWDSSSSSLCAFTTAGN